MRRRGGFALGALLLLLGTQAALGVGARAAAGGWAIERFVSDIEIRPDGGIAAVEVIDVDFGTLEMHGIFRDIPVRYRWAPDPALERRYELVVQSVRDGGGAALPYQTTRDGSNVRIKIGDAGRTVSGKHSYRIAYTVLGVLNGFADHDELFWNVNGGTWDVPASQVRATVRGPAGTLTGAACFQGAAGSTTPCSATVEPDRVTYSAGTKVFMPGEQLTIVATLRKGAVPEPAPLLERRARGIGDFWDASPAIVAAALAVLIGGLGLVFRRWWTAGRDLREHQTIVPEYTPPDDLRPAEIGLLLDERADTKDITATIIDLAVRGHLAITEIPKHGLLGKRDWLLTRKAGDLTALRDYERTILDGLFALGETVTISALRRRFVGTLAQAQSQLYAGSVTQGWFAADPAAVRSGSAAVGALALAAAGSATWLLGSTLGAGLIGLAGFAPAAALLAIAPRMPRKTKAGAELHRRTLGFGRYLEVAETDRQRFAEREHIFSQYLPYAIVYGCVDRWARAFAGIDAAAETRGWYSGGSPIGTLGVGALSGDLQGFAGEITSAIASTPGGSGSSGFSSGSAGGGGGGGGGGGW